LIAKRAHVATGRVSIVRGAAAREKVVRVAGLDANELRATLALPIQTQEQDSIS
jgi:uncharacterized protein YggU (UPF0235/DUF167 family)